MKYLRALDEEVSPNTALNRARMPSANKGRKHPPL